MSKTVLQILLFDGVMLNQKVGGSTLEIDYMSYLACGISLEIDYMSYLACGISFVLCAKAQAMAAGPQWVQVQISIHIGSIINTYASHYLACAAWPEIHIAFFLRPGFSGFH